MKKFLEIAFSLTLLFFFTYILQMNEMYQYKLGYSQCEINSSKNLNLPNSEEFGKWLFNNK